MTKNKNTVIKTNRVLLNFFRSIFSRRFRELYQIYLLFCLLYNVVTVSYRIGFEEHSAIYFMIIDYIADFSFFVDVIMVLIEEKMFTVDFYKLKLGVKTFIIYLKKKIHKLKNRRRKKNSSIKMRNGANNINTFQKQMSLSHKSISFTPKTLGSAFGSMQGSAMDLAPNDINALDTSGELIPAIGRWGRVLKLVTVLKLPGYKRSLENFISEKIVSRVVIRVITSYILLLLVIHIFSCWWFLIARENNDVSNFCLMDNLKEPLLYEALLTPPNYVDDYENTMIYYKFKQYIASVYFASTYIIGFNAPIPQDVHCAVFSCCYVVVGAFFFVYLIGTVTSLLVNMNKSNQEFDDKMNTIGLYMNFKNVSSELKGSIKNYYRCLFRSGHLFSNNEEIFHDLDESVLRSVSRYTKAEAVERVQLFKQCKDEFFIEEICLHLEYLLLLENYILVQEGTIGKELYILLDGSVDIIVGENVVATLKKGSVFGEISLLFPTPRTATIISRETCELYVLKDAHFLKILEKFPEYREVLEEEAKKRLLELQKIKKKK